MYGIVEIGGHQYRVQAGDLLDVEKLVNEAGTDVTFEKVFFVGGEKSIFGLPTVKGAKVTAKVIKHDKARKQLIFKKSPGKYEKKNGHRQVYTALLITEISDGQGGVSKVDAKSKKAQKHLK
jgi:large subunit ribosomal protein L21